VDLQELPDAELVRRCRQGDSSAWSTLVRRFQRLVYTIPRRARLPDQTCADVFQLAFTRLYENIDRIADASRVRAWLVTTARRETLRELELASRERVHSGVDAAATDLQREHRDDDEPVSEALYEVATAEPGESDEERWHELRRALDRLEPRCRQLLELLFLVEPEPSYADIGGRLGMPIGSIGPTRGRCLAQLRRLMT